MLWAFDPKWPEWVNNITFHFILFVKNFILHCFISFKCYPFASAIDTPLPKPKRITCIMLNYKANWARVPDPKEADLFDEYPDVSVESWHKKNRAWVD